MSLCDFHFLILSVLVYVQGKANLLRCVRTLSPPLTYPTLLCTRAKHTPRDYLEVKIFGDHHPDILTEVVDELAALGLDIHKAIVDEHDDGKGHHTDVDTFYCRQLDRSQRGDPFGQLRLYEIRHELTKVFLDHGLHAEIMLHVIAKGDIHMRLRPLQTNQFKDEDIVLISLTGIKTVTMQHDVVEVLHNLGLDVTRATMDKTRGSVRSVDFQWCDKN